MRLLQGFTVCLNLISLITVLSLNYVASEPNNNTVTASSQVSERKVDSEVPKSQTESIFVPLASKYYQFKKTHEPLKLEKSNGEFNFLDFGAYILKPNTMNYKEVIEKASDDERAKTMSLLTSEAKKIETNTQKPNSYYIRNKEYKGHLYGSFKNPDSAEDRGDQPRFEKLIGEPEEKKEETQSDINPEPKEADWDTKIYTKAIPSKPIQAPLLLGFDFFDDYFKNSHLKSSGYPRYEFLVSEKKIEKDPIQSSNEEEEVKPKPKPESKIVTYKKPTKLNKKKKIKPKRVEESHEKIEDLPRFNIHDYSSEDSKSKDDNVLYSRFTYHYPFEDEKEDQSGEKPWSEEEDIGINSKLHIVVPEESENNQKSEEDYRSSEEASGEDVSNEESESQDVISSVPINSGTVSNRTKVVIKYDISKEPYRRKMKKKLDKTTKEDFKKANTKSQEEDIQSSASSKVQQSLKNQQTTEPKDQDEIYFQ